MRLEGRGGEEAEEERREIERAPPCELVASLLLKTQPSKRTEAMEKYEKNGNKKKSGKKPGLFINNVTAPPPAEAFLASLKDI